MAESQLEKLLTCADLRQEFELLADGCRKMARQNAAEVFQRLAVSAAGVPADVFAEHISSCSTIFGPAIVMKRWCCRLASIIFPKPPKGSSATSSQNRPTDVTPRRPIRVGRARGHVRPLRFGEDTRERPGSGRS
jgi:hypothetical protein